MPNQEHAMVDAMLSGVAGAVTLTSVHEVARRITDTAPRMDVLGMRAIARATGSNPGGDGDARPGLHNAALAGDLVANSAYYSLATTWTRGTVLGLLAGVGALALPRRMGLGDPPKSDMVSNQVMTVAWYLMGGLAAAATATCLSTWRERQSRPAFTHAAS
jgi:hypothetical protein